MSKNKFLTVRLSSSLFKILHFSENFDHNFCKSSFARQVRNMDFSHGQQVSFVTKNGFRRECKVASCKKYVEILVVEPEDSGVQEGDQLGIMP